MKEKLVLLTNLLEQVKFLEDEIAKELNLSKEDEGYVRSLLSRLKGDDKPEMDVILKHLVGSGFISQEEASSDVSFVPSIKATTLADIEVYVPVNGGTFVARADYLDSDNQVSVTYNYDSIDSQFIDLVLISADESQNPQIYVWQDPNDEDYTSKNIIPRERIAENFE